MHDRWFNGKQVLYQSINQTNHDWLINNDFGNHQLNAKKTGFNLVASAKELINLIKK